MRHNGRSITEHTALLRHKDVVDTIWPSDWPPALYGRKRPALSPSLFMAISDPFHSPPGCGRETPMYERVLVDCLTYTGRLLLNDVLLSNGCTMPDDARKPMREAGADDLAPGRHEVSPSDSDVHRRPYRDFSGYALFSALIFLIILLMPIGVLYDSLPRRGLRHHRRGHSYY